MEIALASCFGHIKSSKCAKATCFKEPYIKNLVEGSKYLSHRTYHSVGTVNAEGLLKQKKSQKV